jgi:D-3-phosphoglycerate dehydrogenase / 2-oxoglutarate reductase
VSRDKVRIVVAESRGFPCEAAEVLGRIGEPIFADLDRQRLVAAVKEADVLWVRLRTQIDAEVMAAAPRLKIIVTPTTGLNHIDLEEAERRGIRVLSLRGEVDFLREVRATAEHTLALVLALLRNIPAAVVHVQDGGWNRDPFKGRELYGKTIGVVGYGRLGRIVARYLAGLDTQVLAADPYIDQSNVDSGITLVALPELLRRADAVTLHVNLSSATRGFFGREQFSVMRPGAWFFNTSRGELVDEGALLAALQSGHLAGAALDVLCHEDSDGMKAHPLVAYAREHGNLIITPHLGGCTVESTEKTELFLAKKLGAMLSAARDIGGLLP